MTALERLALVAITAAVVAVLMSAGLPAPAQAPSCDDRQARALEELAEQSRRQANALERIAERLRR